MTREIALRLMGQHLGNLQELRADLTGMTPQESRFYYSRLAELIRLRNHLTDRAERRAKSQKKGQPNA